MKLTLPFVSDYRRVDIDSEMSSLKTPANPAINEYYKNDIDHHSTLETVPVDHSTLEPVPYRSDEDGFGAKQIVNSSYDDVEGGSGSRKGGFWKRRVCGISMVVLATVLTIIVLGAVGGGVGGALASKNSDKDNATEEPTSSSIATSTTDGNGQIVATTITVAPTSSASTSTKPTPLPPYPTKAVPANVFLKIGNSRVQGASTDEPWQLEGRWAQANNFGSIGLTPNSTEGDQVWQMLSVPKANEKSKLVYENAAEAGGTPTSLYYIACQRFNQDVRMVVDNTDVERYKDAPGTGTMAITMARQDDEELGQYWWLNQTAEADGIKTFRVHNLKSGKDWRLRASVNEEGSGVASLVSGREEEEGTDLWDVNVLRRIGSQEGWFIYD